MKRILKTLGILILAIVFIVFLAASFIHFKGIPVYDKAEIKLKVELTPERIAKGQKMASVMCVECHLGSDGKLSGKHIPDLPKSYGNINSRNITQDQTAGIGAWTDGELYYLLRTGIGKDGRYIPPYMVKFANASEEDLLSIIAYLRSDKPVVQASSLEPPASEPSFMTKFLSHVAFKPVPLNPNPIPEPDTTNQVAWGKYLTTAVYQCYECHSADFKTNNQLNPELSVGFFGGGNKLLNLNGETIISPNITFDATGIAAYTEDNFVNTMKSGKKINGTQFQYPMLPHAALSDGELKAMFSYLKSIPKISSQTALAN